MSLVNDFLAATVGNVYSAATGNVDPWTKQQLVDNEAAGLVQASGGSIGEDQAAVTAAGDVTSTLKSAGGDPSNTAHFGWFSDLADKLGITDPLSSMKTLLEVAALGIVLVLLVWVGLAVFKRR